MDFFNKEKKKKELLSKEDALALLEEWGEYFELDIESEDFNAIVKELIQPVRHSRISFNPENRTFSLHLFTQIEKQDGSEPISIVTIKAMSMDDKKVIQRYKKNQSIDQATALLAASCGIEIGFASRIVDPDISRINAVNLGFFVQAVPSTDSDE